MTNGLSILCVRWKPCSCLPYPHQSTQGGRGGKVGWAAGDHIASANEHLQAKQLLAQYRQLWHIEYGFRTNKHDLRIRPIYHWTPRRIRAHIAICYMAFCCVQHLRHRLRVLGHPMRRHLNALQYSVLVKSATDEKYAMPSRASAQTKRIYRSASLSWNESPFRLKVKDGGQAKRVRKRK